MSTAEPKQKSKNESAPNSAKESMSIPSSMDIGLEASRKGNFQMARKMFRAAIEQLEGQPDKQPRQVELITNIADSYLNEGTHDSAKTWYNKALEKLEPKNTLQAACLYGRLAEVNALMSEMGDFQKNFEHVQRIYLLCEETEISILLNSLMDLSWVLCIQGHLEEVKQVNNLINQIKLIDEEDRIVAA